jgi:hypothetical protein
MSSEVGGLGSFIKSAMIFGVVKIGMFGVVAIVNVFEFVFVREKEVEKSMAYRTNSFDPKVVELKEYRPKAKEITKKAKEIVL